MSETSTLIGYAGRTINRDELALVLTPPATATHQPVPHHEIVQALVETLGFRHIGVVHDEYAVSPDDMKMFGVLDLETEMHGARFSIGLRNSHDKTMRLALTCGYRCQCRNKTPAILPVLSLGMQPGESARHTNATARNVCERGERLELRDDGQPRWLADSRPSRAVSRNRSSGSQRVLGVESDRFEHEVELIGAIDLARYPVGHSGPEEQGFGEVIEPVDALRVEVPQQEHRTLPVFRP